MATKTTNYNLTKPSYNESADISVINQNMDIIDEKMKEIENASGGGGGGASAWSDISDKPFESIGNGLEVDKNGVMSAIGDTVDAYTKGQTDNLLRNKVDNGIISDEWNSATTYEVGQYCIYNNSLWKCILQHNGQTPEDGTYWTKVSVGSEFNTLNSNLKSKLKSYSSTPNASDLKSAIAVFCALRNSADTFSSFQGLIPNMKTKYIDISTGSVVLKDITWSKTNGTITGDISSYEVRFICIF